MINCPPHLFIDINEVMNRRNIGNEFQVMNRSLPNHDSSTSQTMFDIVISYAVEIKDYDDFIFKILEKIIVLEKELNQVENSK